MSLILHNSLTTPCNNLNVTATYFPGNFWGTHTQLACTSLTVHQAHLPSPLQTHTTQVLTMSHRQNLPKKFSHVTTYQIQHTVLWCTYVPSCCSVLILSEHIRINSSASESIWSRSLSLIPEDLETRCLDRRTHNTKNTQSSCVSTYLASLADTRHQSTPGINNK